MIDCRMSARYPTPRPGVATTPNWRCDARRIAAIPGAHRSGLWASLAHGAHGLVSAPLCAEMLASRLCDEPMPRAVPEVDALHPGRWLIRELIRGR